MSSKNQAESIINRLDLEGIKAEINQNGQNYEIHFGPLADQTDVNQLKTKLQKTTNGQPVIVYTYKN
ncbi:SPOR domain-containing protein [Haemophilus parainfluenzae]|uniref:SPOR domain-containing protein n=1 Tax=Haemophilus parainfluenzae TaxID=729 RepID=UPI001E60AEDA